MLIGYARTSTFEQVAGLDAQVRDLKIAGVEEIFIEQISSVADRPKLAETLKFARKGDAIVVTKMDRLARSTLDLLKIIEELEKRGIGLIILSMNGQQLDTRSPTSKMMLTMLGAVAEFERTMMLERQKEGIAKAKNDGKYKGRKPTAKAKSEAVIKLADEGKTREAIAAELQIGVASVYRILAARAA